MRGVLRRAGVSPSMVVAFVALLVALGGTSYAALKLPRNSVGSAQIKKNAVTSSKVKARSLRLSDFSTSARNGLDGERGPQGPPGERGPQGLPGTGGNGGPSVPVLFYRSATGNVPAGAGPDADPVTAVASSPCAAGEHVTGGGANVSGSVIVTEGYPSPGGNGWTVEVANDGPARNFPVYAICVQSTVGQAP